MSKRPITISLLFFLVFPFVFSQVGSEVDNTRFRVAYQFSFKTATTQSDFAGTELMFLDIGATMSKFYSRNFQRRDSIMTAGLARGLPQHEIVAEIRQYRNALSTIVYSFWEENTFHTTKSMAIRVLYQEPRVRPNWHISGETREISGYTGIRAAAYYLGRNWIVYFTPEIPIDTGPWKLWGLPGLILEAFDEDNLFSFQFSGFQVIDNDVPILYITTTTDGRDYNVVSKEVFRRMERLFYADRVEFARQFVLGSEGTLTQTPEQVENIRRHVASGGIPFIPLEPW